MRNAGDFFCLYELGAFGLHFSQCEPGVFVVVKPKSVDHNRDLPASLKQSQGGGFDRTLCTGSDEYEFVGPHFTEQPFDARLVKWINAAFVEDDLSVIDKQICRQIGAAVGWETYMPAEQCVAYLLLALRAVNTVMLSITIAVSRIDFAG